MKKKTERPPASGGKMRRIGEIIYRERYLWLIALPGILWYAIFTYGPMYGLVIAFGQYSPARGILGGPL